MTPKVENATLLPHGILNRNSERTMREQMIKSDLIESVIGIGKTCFTTVQWKLILICRTDNLKIENKFYLLMQRMK